MLNNSNATRAIRVDSFDDEVTSYVDLMRFNARSLRDCLR